MSHVLNSTSSADTSRSQSTGFNPTKQQNLLQAGLGDPLDYFLGRQGKRIRADLIEVSFQAAGGKGEIPSAITEFVELLHAGSLVIDDIQDNSRNRRQQETLHLKFGIPLAINTGNWMYFAALEKLTGVEQPPARAMTILQKSLSVIKRCHEGQALDLSAAFDQVEPADIPATVEKISDLKTGALTGLAAWLGGSVATSDATILDSLARFGCKLGVGLQMQNDFVELQRVAAGKHSSDDLRNRRCTWPWAWLAEAYPASEVHQLAQMAVDQFPDSRLIAQQVLERVEIVAANEINGTLEDALAQLKQIEVGPEVMTRLSGILKTLELSHV